MAHHIRASKHTYECHERRPRARVRTKIGTMLPCNVIVQEIDGKTEIAAADPVASMQVVKNEELASIAGKFNAELRAVVQSL